MFKYDFISGNKQALQKLLHQTKQSTARATRVALEPLELLDPRNLLQYWANYGGYVSEKRRLRRRNHSDQRRLDSGVEYEEK